MPERTDHVQPDEYLRRATGPSEDVRAVLIAMADRLTHVRPHGEMDDSRRLALILRYATDRLGFGPAGEALEVEVRSYAPRITGKSTRGEYALILRRAAGGAA
ncbi:hypothetical protein [Streptomyces sp. NPDC057910]|uniref:hypothetical protein n=1 Tax=Streptomyces sp. NPDC057910 TaxID=3346278 RepID=UPI001D69CA96|nr:hypothetical protein [Streptomyces sp. MAG02]